MKKNSGFTLVELAIVLVIIGLIIGGILAGTTLIRNAEMNAVVREKSDIEAALNTFRLRYKAIPGDMPNATAIWGARDTDRMNCLTTPTVGTATCNGSGDKRIWNLHYFMNSAGVDQINEVAEALLVWQHLSNAELIRSSLSGNQGAGAGMLNVEIGENSPTTRLGEGTWLLEYIGEMPASFTTVNSPHVFAGSYAQALAIGVPIQDPFVGNPPFGALFTTAESFALDQKLDDGRPGTGILKSLAPIAVGNAYSNNCASSNDPATAEYNSEIDGNECSMIFKLKL